MATAEMHKAVERQTPFFAPGFDRPSYVRWLDVMHPFYREVDQVVVASGFRDAFGTRVFTPKETAVLVELGYDIGSKQAPPGANVDPESLDPLQAPRWLGKALELHDLKVVPQPLQVAQWESVARLVAGTLLLIGFLSRLWAAAMLVAIGTQFALGPARAMAESLFYSLEPGEYQAGFVSLALCALALNVLLVGAGALSIDRAVFGGTSSSEDA